MFLPGIHMADEGALSPRSKRLIATVQKTMQESQAVMLGELQAIKADTKKRKYTGADCHGEGLSKQASTARAQRAPPPLCTATRGHAAGCDVDCSRIFSPLLGRRMRPRRGSGAIHRPIQPGCNRPGRATLCVCALTCAQNASLAKCMGTFHEIGEAAENLPLSEASREVVLKLVKDGVSEAWAMQVRNKSFETAQTEYAYEGACAVADKAYEIALAQREEPEPVPSVYAAALAQAKPAKKAAKAKPEPDKPASSEGQQAPPRRNGGGGGRGFSRNGYNNSQPQWQPSPAWNYAPPPQGGYPMMMAPAAQQPPAAWGPYPPPAQPK